MSKRTLIAAAVLVAWAGTLAWHVKREYFPDRAVQLARGARTLPPGPAYYRLTWEERRLGWARVRLDTIPGGGFRLGTLLEVDAGVLGLPGSLRAETTARLGRDLGLERFSARASGGLLAGLSGLTGPGAGAGDGGPAVDSVPPGLLPSPDAAAGEGAGAKKVPAGGGSSGDEARLRAEGRVAAGDSILVATVERNGRRDTVRVPTGGDLVPLGALPLRLAADPGTGPGRRLAVRLLNPGSLSTTRVEIRVVEEATRSYVDSATQDGTGSWVPATRDTVRAWKLSRTVRGVPVTAWVDEDGRLLEASLGSALRLERTAFQLAYLAVDSAAAAGGDPPRPTPPDSAPGGLSPPGGGTP